MTKTKKLFQSERFYFSGSTKDSQNTTSAWTGGNYYEHLATFEFFGFTIQFWRKKK